MYWNRRNYYKIIMRATDPAICKRIVDLYLNGVGRNESARILGIGETTITDVLNRWKRGIESQNQSLDEYEAVRELAIHCKKEGFGSIADFRQALRIKKFLERLGLDVRDEEESIENFIADLAIQADPIELIDVASQIAQIPDIPLSEQVERVKALKTERDVLETEKLQLQNDVEEQRQVLETQKLQLQKDIEKVDELKNAAKDYLAVNEEMKRYNIDSPRFLGVTNAFKKYNYDCGRILLACAEIQDVVAEKRNIKRLKEELDNDRHAFDTILSTLGLGDLDQFKKIIQAFMSFENCGVGFDQIINLSRSLDLNRLRRQQEWERRAQGWEWGDRDIQENNGGQYAGYPF